ncbi:hypothetical protein, partial [Photobacterium sp. OFAV2-7]|uniref:hypothetical protein n=1 Tax=Photobacterium sp. OFAV2-7 TaxID=2917748 RepID=UPI001EF4AD88
GTVIYKDLGSYAESIAQNKKVVKFGPAFWGIYPGGIAFREAKEAEEYIDNNKELLNEFSAGWAIYQLSGDFALDTKKKGDSHYINKSILVVKSVAKP